MQVTTGVNPINTASLPRITARKLLALSIDDVWASLFGNFILIFDDGEELVTNHKETIYSRYAWEFHNRYFGTPLLKKHHVSTILGGGRVTMKTHLQLLNSVLWEAADYIAPNYTPTQMSYKRYELAELSYEITNRMYNDLTINLEEYAGTLSLADFHSVFKDKDVQEAYSVGIPNDEWITNIYSTIDNVLRRKREMFDNPLSKVYRSSLVSDKQLMQCIGPRGYVTDIDQERFAFPVTRGYYQGIRSYYQYMVETSSAARSLYSAKGPLQDTEYFSRKLQLMCMSVENLHYGDCGTTRYLKWPVKGKSETNPRSDLDVLEGKHYLDENGLLKTITPSDKHLLGSTVHIRSVIYCKHPDPAGVCSTCFGQMSEQIPPNSNLGHICCTHVTEKSSQAVLSTKHLDVSARIDMVMIDNMWQKYLRVGVDGNSYLFADAIKHILKTGRIKIRFPQEGAISLSDIYVTDNIGTIVESRFTEFQNITIQIDNEQYEIPVNHEKRMAYFTWDMLEYIKQVGFDVDDEFGHYVVDMKDWKNTKPFLSLPMKHFSMSDHSKDIAQVLESSVKDVAERDRMVDPATTLVDLATLVNKKISVNLALLEITLYGAMIRSASSYNYALPKPHTESGLGVMKYTILYRSLAAYMAFEHHAVAVYSPESYVLDNRPEHVMDAAIMIKDVIAGGYRNNEQNTYVPGKMDAMIKPSYSV